MGDGGKRSRSQKDNEGNDKNHKRRANDRDRDRDEQGNDEVVAYRILCPDRVIGNVIGKSGKIINAIRQETRAKIKVVDPFPGAKDRVLTIYCYVKEKKDVEIDDEFNMSKPLCPAQDALLRMHAAIANAVGSIGDPDKKEKGREECQLLVPTSQSANIIGKSGATIKKLRSRTKANIKINSKDPSDPRHSCAMEFDNFLQISGDSESVKKSLFAVSAIMYKFTPKEQISLDTTVPEAIPSIIIPSDIPVYPGGLYPSADSMLPSRYSSLVGSTHMPEYPSYGDTGSAWPVYSSALPVVPGNGVGSQSEELTVRVLCSSNKIGRVIGKGGSSIKFVRQSSGARVEVDDARAGREECIITINATEALEDLKSMAVEAVLLLQEKMHDEDEDSVSFRLLVPSKVIGCIIGKSGSIINEIRKRTKADVRISKGEKPKCAEDNEELVEVVGEVGNVRDALVQIVLRLRDDVLKDKGNNRSTNADSFYSSGPDLSMPPPLASAQHVAPRGYEPRSDTGSGFGSMLPSSSQYGYGSYSMGDDAYGYMSSYSSKLYGGLPPPTTLEMVVPAHAVGKVMGKGGANVENIRKISGAAVEISDSKSSRGDRVALISGTAEQKRSAENLIQAFIMAT